MIVSIHQPNIFPWLGYFDKMDMADVFILLDNVPFTKGGFQNRVQLKGSNGPQWLTVPVITKGRLGQITNTVEIQSNTQWKKDHIKTFEALYRNSTSYQKRIPKIEALYNTEYNTLVDFCISGIELIREELNIDTKLVLASDLKVEGNGSALLCEMVKCLGGTTYLSGPSGKNYLNEDMFYEAGIEVKYHKFHQFEYPQRFSEFVGGLSALDYLFNNSENDIWKSRK